MRRPSGKTVLFALIAVALSSAVSLGGLLALDLYLHARFDRVAGINVWGYRGPTVGKKGPGETRLVVVGGSTALGYGVAAEDAMPARLERELNAVRQSRGQGPVRVVNLGFNNEGAYGYRFTLEDYRYLDYDGVILYSGYNDAPAPTRNMRIGRHESPIFRLTGYYAMLPVILSEKALSVRYRGDLEAGARGEKIVFDPTLAERTTVAALQAAERIARSLEAQVARWTPDVLVEPARTSGCTSAWTFFCDSIVAAVDYGLGQRAWVIVTTAVARGEVWSDQQRNLFSSLASRYGSEPRVRTLGLVDGLDLNDRRLSYDGMHLTAAGNAWVAAQLAPVVLGLLR